mgnify:CR=1 FL=1
MMRMGGIIQALLMVLSYQELSPDMNIQPIARISLE